MRVGVLVCSEYANEDGKHYGHMTLDWMSELCGVEISRSVCWMVCDVPNSRVPEVDDLIGFDLIVVTGSPAGAYEIDEKPWIRKLQTLLQDLVGRPNLPKLRVLGICFGHQLLAQALGGKVVKNPLGIEKGLRQVHATAEGRRMYAWLERCPHFSLVMSHGDAVVELPAGGVVLLDNEKGIHGFTTADGRVIGLQGHPEFSKEEGLVCCSQSLLESKRVTAEYWNESRETLEKGGRGDSVGVGEWLFQEWIKR